jgi:hypothetical protein
MMGLHKTSDKLLAAMLIGAVGLVCCIHLALYAQFRSGHILRWRQMQKELFVPHRLPQPAVLSLTGTIWVNIYPSDSFYFELPRGGKATDDSWKIGLTSDLTIPAYRQSGDTLFITGSNQVSIHRPFVDFSYREQLPRVNIYSRGLRDIRLLNGQLELDGSDSAAGAPSIRLTAINSTVWIAEYDEPLHTQPAPKFFDSLDLQLSNSILLLNRSANIRKARISLDGDSELNDRWSTIGRSQIAASDSSRIDLTGNNLKKATIDIHH